MKVLSILANWVLSALTIFIVAEYLKGFEIDSFQTALIVALVLGIFNAVIKPILVILTLPINIVTLGLFTFVINAGLIMATDYLIDGFKVRDFWLALVAAVILWLINIIVEKATFPVKAATPIK